VGAAQAYALRLGFRVRDESLIQQALVHSSWLHEHPDEARGHNERLEHLGDAVVNLAISQALYERHPDDDEGDLSARRAAIVSAPGLARLATRIDLGDVLLLGEGESQRDGRRRPTLLASSFEALAGALYLDVGFEPVRAWLVELASPELDAEATVGALKSPKSRLQEHTQRTIGERPIYRLVTVEGTVLGAGEGPSRRIAETAAAAQAMDNLRSLETPEPAGTSEAAEAANATGTRGA